MCGISGIALADGARPDVARDLEPMAFAMRHRGPDAQGFFCRDAVGLAHRRLSIIDLSDAANQPLYNEDGRVAVVFNGEIYNFAELRAELERAGHRFATRSDTEVLVHGFEEWGTGLYRRLNGIFAFALWDGRGAEPVLHVARDRFGVKPLFYASKHGNLAFASELKPLLGVSWIEKRVEPETLFHFLKFSHVPTPRSILADVRQLEPGTALRWTVRGGLEQERFWDPLELALNDATDAPNEFADESVALAELGRRLDSAVERQLVSDVPVGLFLSGGIDSSLLAAAYESVRGAAREPIRSFSIAYREKEFDEGSHARRMAEAFGTRHSEWVVEPSDLFDVIPEVPTYFDQPFADPTLLSTLLLARFARREVTVALSGDGGDELFFGYPHQRALRWLDRGGLASVPAPLRDAAFGAVEGLAGALLQGPARKHGHRLQKLAGMLRGRGSAELYQSFVGTLGPLPFDRLAGLVANLPRTGGRADVLAQPLFGPLMTELSGLSAEDRVAQVFIRTFLVDTVLAKSDRASMAYGLEARVPFLDDDLVAFAARLPFRHKVRRGSSKHLLRKLLETRLVAKGLPTDLSRRRKQGFSIPLRDWLRGDLRYLVDEYLGEARLRREGCFEPRAVRQLVREHLETGANHSHLLWSLISFQLWKERYL